MDSLLTGHSDIDADHAGIIDTINALETKINANSGAFGMPSLLDAFIQQCEDHFHKEENILKAAAYPQLLEHRQFHQHILGQDRDAQERLEAADTVVERRQYLQLILGFLIDDIMRGDMAFVSYLKIQGLAKEPD